MKRTPLKRKTPLRRKTWMRSRGNTKYRRRPRDRKYMLWVKGRPCCARDFASTPCSGRVEADHAGRRPKGRKADDRTCIPLCHRHHQERDHFHGAFKTWDHDQMRSWLDEMILRYQAAYRIVTGCKQWLQNALEQGEVHAKEPGSSSEPHPRTALADR